MVSSRKAGTPLFPIGNPGGVYIPPAIKIGEKMINLTWHSTRTKYLGEKLESFTPSLLPFP